MRRAKLFGRSALVVVFLAVCGCGSGDSDQVPQNAYCDPVADWPSDFQDWESRIVELMNQARAVGATCGTQYYGPTQSLSVDPALKCAARVHSKDMHDRGFFDHVNPDGDTPADRFAAAGYTGGAWGENIVGGYGSADAQFDGWMSSPGHCSNIMNPGFNLVGVGTYRGSSGYGDYTTAGFGSN